MRYRKVSLGSPQLRAFNAGQSPRVEVDGVLFGATELQIPEVGFGTRNPASLNLTASDNTAWHQRTLHLPEEHRFRIHNAIVHPPYGIITIDNFALQETLGHIPFHLAGYGQSDDEVTLPWEGVGGSLQEALHVMGGNYANHYHWLLDMVPKLQVEPLSPFEFEGSILMSPATSVAQQEMLMHLLLANRPVMILAGTRAIHVESLLFIPNLVGHGFAPNPGLTSFFNQLRLLLGVVETSSHRIYVARKDSQNRVLVNEDEVVALVEQYGFEPVHLSALTLKDQARLFASASHIIAPHGAGLANLVFCNPGVSVCELHMERYLNWCLRRLGGIRSVNYGCVVGASEPSDTEWVHQLRWSAPVVQLEAVLNDRQFMNSAEPGVVTNSDATAALQ